MEMENNTIFSQELDEMRSQVAILKSKLEKQTIINDSHIRQSMKAKTSDITRVIAGSIIAGIFSIPYCTWAFVHFGFSLYFIIATDIMLAVCTAMTVRQRYMLNKLDFTQGNLIDVAEKLSVFKTSYIEWVKIGILMLIVWLGWLEYEAVRFMEQGPLFAGFMAGISIGILIGGIVAFRMNRKILKKSTEILEQIKDLQNTI
jgi:hypothetical protein